MNACPHQGQHSNNNNNESPANVPPSTSTPDPACAPLMRHRAPNRPHQRGLCCPPRARQSVLGVLLRSPSEGRGGELRLDSPEPLSSRPKTRVVYKHSVSI